MLRVTAVTLALLLSVGCYSTTRLRAADPDTLEDDEIASLESCRSMCMAASESDFTACWSRCPSVVREEGRCSESRQPSPFCSDQTSFDSRRLTVGVAGVSLIGGVALTTMMIVGLNSLAEAIANDIWPEDEAALR